MPNVKVNVLTTYNSPNSLGFIYPFVVNRQLLMERGVTFGFYENIRPDIYACDAIFLNSKFFRSWHTGRQRELYETLAVFKKKIKKVIWFDTADSTGTTQFNVMPFVDGYYKSQVLKDRSLYEKSFYGNRIFTDYYKALFGKEDTDAAHEESEKDSALSVPLKKEHICKFGVSWNSGMNDWGIYIYNYTYTGLAARLRSRLPFGVNYSAGFMPPASERKTDVCGRIGLSHARNTVRLQREKIAGILKTKFGVNTATVSRARYIGELRDSRVAVSPFGLGEISCRDFEIITSGALLFKQDMSHLETWPPLYANDETYASFSWDLSDFEDKLRTLISSGEKIKKISENAQHAYEYYLYGGGRTEFCDKVTGILR